MNCSVDSSGFCCALAAGAIASNRSAAKLIDLDPFIAASLRRESFRSFQQPRRRADANGTAFDLEGERAPARSYGIIRSALHFCWKSDVRGARSGSLKSKAN